MRSVRATPRPSVPRFVDLAAHPVRWQLLSELARSDRHVGELTELIGAPQPLVSYHLGRLRRGELVTTRRSDHDARSSYYRLDLDRCGVELVSAATSLHAGLRLRSDASPSTPAPEPGRPHGTRARVLFACTGNGSRSQIAEALLRCRAGDRIDVVSGGSHPKPIHPNATRVLAERGIDISGRHSKPLSTFDGQAFDVVVTLCDRVREVCPEFPARIAAIHWSIGDPGRATGGVRATVPVFRALADDLASRIEYLIATIDHHRPTTT